MTYEGVPAITRTDGRVAEWPSGQLKPSPTKNSPYVEDYDIGYLLDELLDTGGISIVAK